MPSFAIEAVPEAVPLQASTLVDILRRAASADQQQVQTAAQQLQNWERQPGYYRGLQTVFADVSFPVEVRHLAIIALKNGIDKYWRKTAQNAISKDDKSAIRAQCVPAGLHEPETRLALQNAIVVAKIVRHEFPHDWPDALSSMTATLQAATPTELPRILLLLLYVVKELATAKLQRSRASLYGAAPDLFRALGAVYVQQVHRWTTEDDAEAIHRSLLALRVLRRLITAGYQRPAEAAEVQELWGVVREHFGHFHSLHAAVAPTLRPVLEKHLVQIAKLHLGVVREHPTAFPQLPDAIGIAQSYWRLLVEYGQNFGVHALDAAAIGTDGDAEEGSWMEQLSLKALLLLRACVKMVYDPAPTIRYVSAAEKTERQQSRAAMHTALLSPALVREMMETLVVRFFVFRPRDLREWETEPDEWERMQEGADSWEHSVRICAEKLFLDLVLNNKALVEPLLAVFRQVATTAHTDVLVKDSVYAAIGLAAPILDTHLDFGAFLQSTLVPEVQMRAPGYRLLRRRIAIVIGQWITVAAMDRTLVYQVFQHLLDPHDDSNDLVVRVTAGRQLQRVMDPWDIEMQGFTPFAATILARVLALTQEVPLAETKLALLHTLRTVVQRLEHLAAPFAEQILSALPPLWEDADDDYLLKQTILGILSALMSAIGAASERYHPLILPLMASSLDPAAETRVYLIEDALDLWAAVVTQATQPTPDLLRLAPQLHPLFQSASDNLVTALQLEELYIVLAPDAWVADSSAHLARYADLLGGKLSMDARAAAHTMVEALVQARPQALLDPLAASALLPLMLRGLRSAYDARQVTGPHRPAPSIDDYTETFYFCVLARLVYADPPRAMAAVGDAAWFLEEWFLHFETIPHATHKKLCGLALTALLGVDAVRPLALARLQDLLSLWTTVLYECCETEEDGSVRKDTLVYERHQPVFDASTPPPTPDAQRRHEMMYGDPVHTVPIHTYVQAMLARTVAACGGQEVFQREWLVNVDPDVLQSFGALRL